jgi:hypothetical protein
VDEVDAYIREVIAKNLDKMAIYTYGLIARIAMIDPDRAANLRRYYSAALMSGDPSRESAAGMDVERAHGEYGSRLYAMGVRE